MQITECKTTPSGILGDHCYFSKCFQLLSQSRLTLHFSMQLLLLSLCSSVVLPVTCSFISQTDFTFLLNKKEKNCKNVSFLALLIARKLSQYCDIQISSMRFPTYAVLLSLMVLNIIIRTYTVLLIFFGFCPYNS